MSSFGHTPSFSSPGSFGRGEGMSYGSRGAAEGMNGGRIEYGSRSGSYDTARGGTINYGAAGVAGRGPGGARPGAAPTGSRARPPGAGAHGRRPRRRGRRAGRERRRRAVELGAVSGRAGPPSAARGGRGGRAGGAVAGGVARRPAYRPYGYNAYGGYHSGWVHGYWNGHNDAAWGWRNPYWGGGDWGWGSAWGWAGACRPGASARRSTGWATCRTPTPITARPGSRTANRPWPRPTTTRSRSTPRAAPPTSRSPTRRWPCSTPAAPRSSRANYADALQQTDDALAKLPNDTTLHEFRALCLFALGRYDEAAATLYAVLSVGPGWDWTTLIGLYPSVDVYTAQLRALEDYCDGQPPTRPPARFVLAYHYLTQGHTEAAVGMLKQVVALKPGDTLSAKLLRQLDPPRDQPRRRGRAPPRPTRPRRKARRSPGPGPPGRPPTRAIALTVQPGGAFTWQVTQKGQTQQFSGTSTYGDGILTLAQDKGPALVGRVSWTDAEPHDLPDRRRRPRRPGAELLEVTPTGGTGGPAGPPRPGEY